MADTKVLIVEDESIVALDIRMRLKRKGYTVVGVADTGDDAVAMALNLDPDIVLMDVRLKGDKDGIAAVQEIRRRRQMTVIYLTASMDPPTVQRAHAIAPAPFLPKPFEITELCALIDSSVNKREVQ
ncbi:MAG: response regulator [Anaerolineae bacterium]|nr:response regulator [Anaerolineae bacterium]